jgi:hypothetical protein
MRVLAQVSYSRNTELGIEEVELTIRLRVLGDIR